MPCAAGLWSSGRCYQSGMKAVSKRYGCVTVADRLRSGGELLHELVRHIEIGGNGLHVIVVLERRDELEKR